MTASISEQAGLIDLASGLAYLHELRDAEGKWTRTPGDKPGTGIDRYVVPPHSRLINPRADYPDPADMPFFKKHPVSADNIIAAYDAVPKAMLQDGMDWYYCAHLLAKAMGHGKSEEAAILLSNYSNSANWPINMFRAAKVAEEGKPIPKGQGYISGDQVRKAQKALDGQHIDQVLPSPKQRSFAFLLARGDDDPSDPYGHVVIDAHALNVAAGGSLRGATYHRGKKIPPEDDPPVGKDVRAHEYVGDMYRQAARYISKRDGVLIKPHQMQAITWVAQVLANQAEDKAVMEGQATGGVLGRAKGRIANEVKDWRTWLGYAKAHHLPLVPGVSALAAQVMFAQIIELIGGDSITAQLDLAFWQHEPRNPHSGEWVSQLGPDLMAVHAADNETRATDLRRHARMVKIAVDVKASHERAWQRWGEEHPVTRSPAADLMNGAADDFEAGRYADAASKLDQAHAETQTLIDQRKDYDRLNKRMGDYLKAAQARIGSHRDRARWAAQHLPDYASIAEQEKAAGIVAASGGLAAQVIDLFNPHERRDEKGRWTRGGIAAQALRPLDPYYNELPESGHRGTVRSKGTFGSAGTGRDAEDQAKIDAYRRAHPAGHDVPAGADLSKTKRVRQWITAAEARGNSRPVSFDEYQRLAAEGNAWVDRMKNARTPVTGLDRHWGQVKARAYREAQKSWGGQTIDSHTGIALAHNADRYAISVKPQGMDTVSVPETASEDEFNAAMDRALAMFRPVLERQSYYLGVFHDDEHHRIDIDPVAVVATTDLVEQVGAYTRAIGGAYHFRSGDGYWPPHVAEGMGMADDDEKIHWDGIGQWHSQAVEIQDPEPDDEPED